MSTGVRSFLEEVRSHLHLDPGTEKRVISELSTHFHDKVADLCDAGVAREEAEREAIRSFGGARSVARMIYETYSRGSWVDALLACQPHLLMAYLFATHLWREPLVISVCFLMIAVVAILGWRAGSPVWTYSWAGYAFFPPLVLAYLARGVPLQALALLRTGRAPLLGAAELVGTALLFALATWMLVGSAIRVSSRDWILVSLMFVPLTVLGIWAYAVEQSGDFLLAGVALGSPSRFDLWDHSMAWMCLVLGGAAATFVRMRARLLKGLAVVAVGIVSGALVADSLSGGIGFRGIATVSLCMFLVLVSPLAIHALIERLADRSAPETEEARAS